MSKDYDFETQIWATHRRSRHQMLIGTSASEEVAKSTYRTIAADAQASNVATAVSILQPDGARVAWDEGDILNPKGEPVRAAWYRVKLREEDDLVLVYFDPDSTTILVAYGNGEGAGWMDVLPRSQVEQWGERVPFSQCVDFLHVDAP
jgi:hypothetical protein